MQGENDSLPFMSDQGSTTLNRCDTKTCSAGEKSSDLHSSESTDNTVKIFSY